MRPLFTALACMLLPLAGAAQPPVVPDAPVMNLDEIGIYRVGYAYRGQPERDFAVGWSGDFDDTTGVACRPAGEQNGKRAFLLHCPWRGGTGITFQEFRFALPRARRIVLRGATALRSDIVGQSDGVTFHVSVDGRRLLDENRTDSEWRPFEFDLTGRAGRTVTVRFETDPGPKDNPSFDFALWGDRQLVLEGFRPAAARRPAPPPLNLRALWSVQTGTVAPNSGFPGSERTILRGGTATFRYSGSDGTLTYAWSPPARPQEGLFGTIVLQARMKGDRPVSIRLASAAAIRWAGPAAPLQNRWVSDGSRITLVRTFRVGADTATVRLTGSLWGKSLVTEVSCDRPVAEAFDAGGWGPVLRRRQVITPYYGGQVYYLPAQNLFVNAFLDWTGSHAAGHDGARASYPTLTDGTRNLLRERAVYTAAWHMAEVLPNIPNPPSPYRKHLAGRIVLDSWGGRYVDIARHFQELAALGIDRCVALIHDWQRSGYDNALPAHVPAAADKGGDPGMRTLVQTGVRLGYDVALHENYVDYYPNYELFSPNDIALDPAGNRVPAWYNPGTKIQSFAVKPNAILPLARTQSPEIHRRYGTNADYLDVHSAVPPWFHVDFRAGETGAGMFDRVWKVHRELWQYERKTHGGPVFGEGANHWYWSGLLDGVEAQFGVGWPGGQGLTAPLAVDFDLLKVHPLQFNHGMGYYERWWSNASWGAQPPMVVLDQYRMQEVAYGHAGFLAGSTWAVPPLAWLEHHLLAPVMWRYAAASPTAIDYQVGGRWVDGTAAAKAGDWNRVRVRYDSGLVVTANNARDPLRVAGGVLPQYGWLAVGAGVRAGTVRLGEGLGDFAITPASVFVNARSLQDWNNAGIRRVRPTVSAFEQTGPRAFRVTYHWNVQDTLPVDFHAFVHFDAPAGPNETIRFQQDHATPTRTSSWRPGQVVVDGPYEVTVPADAADGDYPWTIGLFEPSVGRASLAGVDDGRGRIRLGVLQVRESGRIVRFVPERETGEGRLALYARNLNPPGRPIDFGPIRTDGSVLVRREGGEWVLRTMPRGRAFTLELSAARWAVPSAVRCIGGSAPALKPTRSGRWWRITPNGAREYRWR